MKAVQKKGGQQSKKPNRYWTWQAMENEDGATVGFQITLRNMVSKPPLLLTSIGTQDSINPSEIFQVDTK
jgi:hypothetical protein